MDQGTPRQTADTTATVTVNVDRNLYAPVFINPASYVVTINENLAGGSSVIQISTKDNDTVVRLSYLK